MEGKENFVCKLNKSIYGLKQSPRQWNKRFDEFMACTKFKRSKFDNCVYFKIASHHNFVILLLYVDDILIASNNKDKTSKVCGSNAFQDYFDDAKESRVKKVSRIKNQDSRFKNNQDQDSRFK